MENTLVIILQFYRLIVVQAEKRKGLKPKGEMLTGKSPSQSSNAIKKRGTSPGAGVDSARNLRGTKIVKVAPSSSVAGSRGAKSPKSPKRAVAKLVRTASEDDGAAVYPSPAHSSAFLLHTENDTSWRQYSRVGYVLPIRGWMGDNHYTWIGQESSAFCPIMRIIVHCLGHELFIHMIKFSYPI